MQLDPQFLKQVIEGIATTQDDEIDCMICFEHLDNFAEQVLAGKPASEAMPLVQEHLNRCPLCREEFEALLDALKQFESK